MQTREEIFNFWLPATVLKAETDKDGKRWIQGVASTDHLDLQGERVTQKGIDFNYFLKKGYINDDHNSGPEYKVGEPTEAKVTKDGFWLKGFLYKGQERSDYWWKFLNSLEESGSSRRVGFSIQGKVERRAGNKIDKCWIQDVAITAAPVNTHTWAEIIKSLSSESWCEVAKGCSPDCSGDCDHEKALSTSSGAAMIPESLEGGAKIQTYKSFSDIPEGTDLSYDDCVRVLQLDKGWSRPTAQAVADAIFIEKGLK